MRNFVQPGDVLDLTAPAALTAGQGVLIGALFGVAAETAASGATFELHVKGVYDLPKVGSQAWTVGALVYWDAANARCTTTAAGNTLIGHCVLAVGSGAGETIGRVRLSQ